ncbi:M23 family metallopeptidase [Candidatus Pacearchaeota archaeon]|nr:M23 family metallopeptidase [Candidatus Pacearchaeota archaeon]
MKRLKSKNVYRFPIVMNRDTKITYDASPAHKGRLKNAVDFIVPEGTCVRAAFDGKIIDVKQDSDIGGNDESFDKHGNYIEIEHSNEEYSIYEHIRKNGSIVKIGDIVKEGQSIGFSGNTGWMGGLGPHLHFDVHIYFGEGPEDYETIKIMWEKEKL